MPESDEHTDARAGVLVVKTTVALPTAVLEALRQLAKTRNTTLAKVISDAIELEQYVHERTQKGGRVLVEGPDKSLTQLWIR